MDPERSFSGSPAASHLISRLSKASHGGRAIQRKDVIASRTLESHTAANAEVYLMSWGGRMVVSFVETTVGHVSSGAGTAAWHLDALFILLVPQGERRITQKVAWHTIQEPTAIGQGINERGFTVISCRKCSWWVLPLALREEEPQLLEPASFAWGFSPASEACLAPCTDQKHRGVNNPQEKHLTQHQLKLLHKDPTHSLILCAMCKFWNKWLTSGFQSFLSKTRQNSSLVATDLRRWHLLDIVLFCLVIF